jgi:hypothetical protein
LHQLSAHTIAHYDRLAAQARKRKQQRKQSRENSKAAQQPAAAADRSGSSGEPAAAGGDSPADANNGAGGVQPTEPQQQPQQQHQHQQQQQQPPPQQQHMTPTQLMAFPGWAFEQQQHGHPGAPTPALFTQLSSGQSQPTLAPFGLGLAAGSTGVQLHQHGGLAALRDLSNTWQPGPGQPLAPAGTMGQENQPPPIGGSQVSPVLLLPAPQLCVGWPQHRNASRLPALTLSTTQPTLPTPQDASLPHPWQLFAAPDPGISEEVTALTCLDIHSNFLENTQLWQENIQLRQENTQQRQEVAQLRQEKRQLLKEVTQLRKKGERSKRKLEVSPPGYMAAGCVPA